MHDANHGSFSSHRWLNGLLSFTSDALGASSWLWRFQHNTLHHGNANVAGFDADIALAPFARLSPSQPWHPWYRAQHVYLWPLYGFLALKNLLVSDTVALVTGRLDQQPLRQPVRSRIVAQIVGRQGRPPHLGSGDPAAVQPVVGGTRLLFDVLLARRVRPCRSPFRSLTASTSRPCTTRARRAAATTSPSTSFAPPPTSPRRCPVIGHLLRWMAGGLNHQIEHHLAPRLPHTVYPLLAETLPAGLPRPQDHLSPPSQHLGSNAFPRSLAANDEHPARDTIGSDNLLGSPPARASSPALTGVLQPRPLCLQLQAGQPPTLQQRQHPPVRGSPTLQVLRTPPGRLPRELRARSRVATLHARSGCPARRCRVHFGSARPPAASATGCVW